MTDLYVILRCPYGHCLRRWVLRDDGMIGVDLELARGTVDELRRLVPAGAKRADSMVFGAPNAVEAWR